MGNFVSVYCAKQGSLLSIMTHPKSVRRLQANLEGIKHKIILLQLISIFNLKGGKMVYRPSKPASFLRQAAVNNSKKTPQNKESSPANLFLTAPVQASAFWTVTHAASCLQACARPAKRQSAAWWNDSRAEWREWWIWCKQEVSREWRAHCALLWDTEQPGGGARGPHSADTEENTWIIQPATSWLSWVWIAVTAGLVVRLLVFWHGLCRCYHGTKQLRRSWLASSGWIFVGRPKKGSHLLSFPTSAARMCPVWFLDALAGDPRCFSARRFGVDLESRAQVILNACASVWQAAFNGPLKKTHKIRRSPNFVTPFIRWLKPASARDFPFDCFDKLIVEL